MMGIIRKFLIHPLKRHFPYIADHAEYLLREIYVAFVHQAGKLASKKYLNSKGLQVNFGSADKLKEGFLNIDFSPGADLRLDLRRPIPLPDGSCSMIFSEHFVEHLAYPEGVRCFFSECFRLLEPGGSISITVPDTYWPLKDYIENRTEYLKACDEKFSHPDECTTFMEHINYHFRQRWSPLSYSHFENHRFAYDFETMSKRLHESGFSNITQRAFDGELDSAHRELGSLSVSAEKPG